MLRIILIEPQYLSWIFMLCLFCNIISNDGSFLIVSTSSDEINTNNGGGVHAGHVTFRDCHKNRVKELFIAGCGPDQCMIQDGKPTWGFAVFVPDANYTHIKRVMQTGWKIFPVPLPSTEFESCKSSDLPCPVVAGKETKIRDTFRPQLPWIARGLPKFLLQNITVKAILVNGASDSYNNNVDNPIACAEFVVSFE